VATAGSVITAETAVGPELNTAVSITAPVSICIDRRTTRHTGWRDAMKTTNVTYQTALASSHGRRQLGLSRFSNCSGSKGRPASSRRNRTTLLLSWLAT
jgi:hypothetical protein